MDKEYYYIDDKGEQFGPYTLEIFRLLPLRRRSYVWSTGMEEWVTAGEMKELDGFIRKSEPTTDIPTDTAEPELLTERTATATEDSVSAEPMPKTWLTESILLTILCSVIGLIPFFHGMQVRSLYRMGEYEGAARESATAKRWLFIAAAIGLVVDALYLLLFFRDNLPLDLP